MIGEYFGDKLVMKATLNSDPEGSIFIRRMTYQENISIVSATRGTLLMEDSKATYFDSYTVNLTFKNGKTFKLLVDSDPISQLHMIDKCTNSFTWSWSNCFIVRHPFYYLNKNDEFIYLDKWFLEDEDYIIRYYNAFKDVLEKNGDFDFIKMYKQIEEYHKYVKELMNEEWRERLNLAYLDYV